MAAFTAHARYGRQLLVPSFGLPSQLALHEAHVLVVGLGGLGCPAALTLATSGVGELTLVDHDTVEESNLHRQVLHTEGRVGMAKVESASRALKERNSALVVHTVADTFDLALVTGSTFPPAESQRPISLVLDCCDNPRTRYFVNAFCVAQGVTLVSGGAVRADGVVGVYNLPLKATEGASLERGPCYACMFPPAPPPPAPGSLSQAEQEKAEERAALLGSGRCSDEGVLGILCAAVGSGMASEATRVLMGIAQPTLHLLSPLSSPPSRTLKPRPRKATCSCSTITRSTLASAPIPGYTDAVDSCWVSPPDGEGRVDAKEAKEVLKDSTIIDVRSETEYGIWGLEGSCNVPLDAFLRDPLAVLPSSSDSNTLIVCRRGNDSFLAARALRRSLREHGREEEAERIVDLKGGLEGWARQEGGIVY